MNQTKTKRPTQRESALQDLRELIQFLVAGTWVSRSFREDLRGRPIMCTPYDGAYGPAGWIIVVNGSPPRCTFICEHRSESPVVIVHGRARRLGQRQREIVSRFCMRWLVGRTSVVTISACDKVTA